MNFKASFGVALVVALSQCSILVSAAPVKEGEGVNPFLMAIGSIDGKTYFYDKSNFYTWSAAKTYCQGVGMRLATITTPAQQTFLKSKYASGRFDGAFWFGARDARAINQFAWDYNNAMVPNVGQTWAFTTMQTCVYYTANSLSYNGRWDSYQCNSNGGSLGVMCETV